MDSWYDRKLKNQPGRKIHNLLEMQFPTLQKGWKCKIISHYFSTGSSFYNRMWSNVIILLVLMEIENKRCSYNRELPHPWYLLVIDSHGYQKYYLSITKSSMMFLPINQYN